MNNGRMVSPTKNKMNANESRPVLPSLSIMYPFIDKEIMMARTMLLTIEITNNISSVVT
jgi:hypothetical protein